MSASWSTEQAARHRRTILAWLLGGNVMVAALLATMAALSLVTSHEAFQQRARGTAENLAESLHKTIGAELLRVDMGLRTVVATVQKGHHGHPLSAGELDELLEQQQALMPQIDGLRMADAQGWVMAGRGVQRGQPFNMSDRPIFQRLRNEAVDQILLSEPLQSRISRQWVLVAARRLQGPDGRFTGIVYATIPLAHLQRLITGVDVGKQGAVTLRSATLQLIARHTSADETPLHIGDSQTSVELTQALRIDPLRGSFIGRAAMDGIERYSAYQRVEDFPLLVLVGLGTDEFLAPWRTQRVQVVGLVLLIVQLVALASWMLYRAWQRQAEAMRRVAVEARRNHALLRTASDGIHVLDRQGHVVELSNSFARMLDRSPEELIGQHVSSWDAQLDLDTIENWLTDFPIGEQRKLETRHRRKDGSIIEVELYCASVQIDGRNLIYCSARDISERKRLQAELAATAEQVRDLYDHAPCGYHSVDGEGRFLHVNDTESAWLGPPPEALIGKRFIWEFFTPAGRAQFRTEFPRLMAQGHVEGLEFELRPEAGEPRHVSISASAIYDEDGRFVKSRSVMYDISELQRAREQLRQAMLKQQAMLDNDLIGILISHQRQMVWSNPAMARIFGYTPAELLQQPVRLLYADDDSYRRLIAEAFPVMLAGGRYRTQVQTQRKDGTPIWIDVNGVLLSRERQESLWLIADITPIKESQQRAEHIAFHDALTGLPNRLLLADRLGQALAAAERQQRSLAVCYLDLDGFKEVNDQLGHAAGDTLLVEVALRLQACVRASDTVCRLGGDEFVLLLSPLDDEQELDAVLKRVSQALDLTVPLTDGRTARVSVSIGVAVFPQDGTLPDILLGNADRAMYQAKRDGRRRVRRYATLDLLAD